MIHPLAEVQTLRIGLNTTVWQYTIILKGAVIGNNCNINCHVFIENDVIIGDNVTIKSGVYLWDGISLGNNVFVGPNVTFVNDKIPRSQKYPDSFDKTLVRNHASIGAGSTILGGIEIGEYSMVGAGSLVTKSVPDRALVFGNPAKQIAWLNDDGTKMIPEEDFFIDKLGCKWRSINNILRKL